MRPAEANESELRRLREAMANGDRIDWKREAELAAIDDAIAEAVYTREAIDRVHAADDQLERLVNVNGQ